MMTMNAILPAAPTPLSCIASLSSPELTERLRALRGEERVRTVDFVRLLAELDTRDVLPGLGFASTFAFCVEHLGLSRGAAYRRCTAARLVRRFPVLADHLADGRLNLTTLCELRDVLHEDTLDDVLAQATGRSEDDVKRLVVRLRPKPIQPELLRRLPSAGTAPGAMAGPLFAGHIGTTASGPTVCPPALAGTPTPPAPRPPTPGQDRPAPVAEGRYALRLTVDDTFVADLEAVRSLLSHQRPAARTAELLHECLRIARATLAKRRGRGGTPSTAKAAVADAVAPAAVVADQASVAEETAPSDATVPGPVASSVPAGPAPAESTDSVPSSSTGGLGAPTSESTLASPPRRSRHIPAAVARAVWARDGQRCAFVAPDGRRCTSTHQLELHHIVAFALGGEATVHGLSVRCRAHNLAAAREDLGPARIAAVVADRRRTRRARRA